jgi:putative spermidine/putrescine transport system ATP-binding protein
MVSVRPERAFLVNGEGGDFNRFSAAVKEIIYLGDHVRIRLDLAGRHDFTVKTPISQLDRQLRSGDQVMVGMAPEHACALDPIAEAH